MQIIDLGTGTPLVIIPGIQGRWEYMRPAIAELAASFRVVTFSLCGERASHRRFDTARGFDDFVDQIDAVLDDRRLAEATICGVSFGGLVALRFAARRPERTSALILVSPPGPDFRLVRRHRIYMRLPRLLGPLFLAEVPCRVRAEIAKALPDRLCRLRFAWGQLTTLAQSPISLSRMAARAQLLNTHDQAGDCARVQAPTLVVSGEPSLDRVVSADGTAQYLRLIPHAHAAQLERTGHLGYITRPREFASVLCSFLATSAESGGASSTQCSRAGRDQPVHESRNDAA